jgi:thioredoxin 2
MTERGPSREFIMHRLRSAAACAFAALSLLLVGCSDRTAPAEPESSAETTGAGNHEGNAFTALSFDEAMQANKESGELLLVDATATWCKPCKRMEREAWSHPDIVTWVEERGLAIQFDIDEHKDLKKSLGIEGIPAIIAFRNGEEIGRKVGYRSLEDFKAWLASLG